MPFRVSLQLKVDALVYTERYCRPGEVGTVDARSDWYALGVTVEELLVRTARLCVMFHGAVPSRWRNTESVIKSLPRTVESLPRR